MSGKARALLNAIHYHHAKEYMEAHPELFPLIYGKALWRQLNTNPNPFAALPSVHKVLFQVEESGDVRKEERPE